MKLYLIILLFNHILYLATARILHLEDIDLDPIIERLGLSYKTYTVITNDSYILTMHRLTYPRLQDDNFGPPVLLMHGLSGSSIDWLITGNSGLALMLLKNGYDVWLGNTRGSPFSSLRVTKTELPYNLWDYSWHEMGLYDIPKIIDKVLEITQQDKIYYVGYSQGSTEFFVLTSMLPEYNNKIQLMVGLAPAVYTGQIDTIPRLISIFVTYPFRWFTEKYGHFRLLFCSSIIRMLTNRFCNSDSYIIQSICVIVRFFVVDNNEPNNQELLSKYLLYSPSSGSTKQYLHYSQFAYRPDDFGFYDYGKEKNELIYNNPEPPNYPLKRVEAPVYIFHSSYDTFVPPKGIQLLKSKIKNCIGTLDLNHFNHMDFLFGRDRVQLYDKVLGVMKSIQNPRKHFLLL